LEPGQDIYAHLREVAAGRSMFVLSCVGSVTTVGLRLAGLLSCPERSLQGSFLLSANLQFPLRKGTGKFQKLCKNIIVLFLQATHQQMPTASLAQPTRFGSTTTTTKL